MTKLIKKYTFFFYLFLAFPISWLGWLVLIFTNTEPGFFNPWKLLAAFGPSMAGIITILLSSGKQGLKMLWQRLSSRQTRWYWYIFCLAAPPALMLGALGIHTLVGGQGLTYNDPAELYLVIPVFLLVFFFSVLGEEIGWRGFALPWLQKRFNALVSSLILGLIWALWHLPLFFIPGDFHQQLSFIWFVLQTVSITILYTWLFNTTNGNLLLILLLHSSSNTAFGVLPMLPEAAGGSSRPAWILNLLLIIFVVIVTLVNKPKTLTGKKS